MGKKKIILAFAVLFLVLGAGAAAASEIEDAKTEMEDIKDRKEETEKKINELEHEKGNIVSYIQKLDEQLNELTAEIDILSEKIDLVKADVRETKAELTEAGETENRQYDTMKRRIKYMYENGANDYLEILFGAVSVSDLLNRGEYIAKIAEYDNQLLDNYKETKESISEKEEELEIQLAELKRLNEEAEYEKSTVEQLSLKKAKELKKYEKDINRSEMEAAQYAESIEQQEELIEKLLEQERIRIQAAQREEAARKKQDVEEKGEIGVDGGGFCWPLTVSGTITSEFGGRTSPTEGASSNHMGVDIAVPTGTPVIAADGGSVVTASYQAAAGNYVMIYHGGSTFTVYMHCSQLVAEVGQEVSKGEVIAYSGSTGISTGPHLHFGLSIDGSYVNPLDYVSR